jgi:hypothetical protein
MGWLVIAASFDYVFTLGTARAWVAEIATITSSRPSTGSAYSRSAVLAGPVVTSIGGGQVAGEKI